MTVAAAAWASAAIAAGAAVYSGVQQNKVAKFNEGVANQEADYQRRKGSADEQAHWRKVNAILGQQKTEFAAAGVSLLSGSVVDTYESTVTEAELDAAAIRTGTEIAVAQADVSAIQSRAEGRAALTEGIGRAGTTLIGTKAKLEGF